MTTQTHMWLAGDGEGVILVCEGPCPNTPAGDLVVAEYGQTATRRADIPSFPIGDLEGFLDFVNRHRNTCKTSWEPDEPNWNPLEAVLPSNQYADWMWMNRIVYDGHTIEQYKHIYTRGYIRLSSGGQAWRVNVTWNDYCTPFCREQHEHTPQVSTVTAEPIPLSEAFDDAGVDPMPRTGKL